MKRYLLPAMALIFLVVLVAGCSDDEDDADPTSTVAEETPEATATAAEAGETPVSTETGATPGATGTVAATQAPPSPTAEPGSTGEVGPDTVLSTHLDVIAQMYAACEDMTETACLTGVVEDAGVPAPVLQFWEQHGAFLVSFEEHGTVDYGYVSFPVQDMARPQPAFLNGDFGMMHAFEALPDDWQSETSYQALGLVNPWSTFTSLVEVTATDQGQSFEVQTALRECRACEDVGYLTLRVVFDDGAYAETEVLPFTDEPASADAASTVTP